MTEAAPDAATERVTKNSVRHVKRLTTELQNKRESLNDQRREFRKLLSKRDRIIDGLRAERDAALAVIERVQENLSLHNQNGRLVKEVLAALDGAPEPEWEYAHREGGKVYDEPSTPLAAAKILNSQPVRRRKADPWLPVEGEGKP